MLQPSVAGSTRPFALPGLALAAIVLAGCSLMPGNDDLPPAAVFMLAPAPAGAMAPDAALDCGVLRVRPAQPAPGFLTDRMLYSRQPNQIEQFSRSRWVDVPARMIDSFIVERLAMAAFGPVVSANAPTDSRYRLDISQVRLLQTFEGDASEVTLSFDAVLFDTEARRQLVSRRLALQEAAGGDARSGVRAANAALGRALDELAQLVRETLVSAEPGCA